MKYESFNYIFLGKSFSLSRRFSLGETEINFSSLKLEFIQFIKKFPALVNLKLKNLLKLRNHLLSD